MADEERGRKKRAAVLRGKNIVGVRRRAGDSPRWELSSRAPARSAVVRQRLALGRVLFPQFNRFAFPCTLLVTASPQHFQMPVPFFSVSFPTVFQHRLFDAFEANSSSSSGVFVPVLTPFLMFLLFLYYICWSVFFIGLVLFRSNRRSAPGIKLEALDRRKSSSLLWGNRSFT